VSKFKDQDGQVREFFTTARWEATVVYNTEAGPTDVEYQLDSLSDLAEHLANGPDFHAIIGISIVYLGYRDPTQALAVTTLEGVGVDMLGAFLNERRRPYA